LSGTHVDIGAFTLKHLTEVAKTTHENVISVGATIIAIAESVGHNNKFHSLELQFLGGVLDIATLAHMSILDTRGGTIRYPHHKETLFTFPAVAQTAIANKRNWNCDRVIIRERVLPPEQEEEAQEEEGEFDEGDEGDEGNEEAQEAPPASDLLPFSHHLHHPNPIPMAILILVGPLPQAKHLMVLLFSSHLPLSS